MNLFCGFLAILNVAEGRLAFGAWLIALAGLFDVMDGFMARLSNATSDFGIELDSLSDIVSFGVAPGFLLYSYSMHELQLLGVITSALPPLCGAVRLARFNVEAHQSKESKYFRGLPIPAQAVMVASFYLTFYNMPELFSGFQYGVNSVIIPILVILSLLMVSTVPFDKIPRFDREVIKDQKGTLLLFLIYLIAIIVFQEFGLIAVFTVFILKGLLLSAVRFYKAAQENGKEPMEEDERVMFEDFEPEE